MTIFKHNSIIPDPGKECLFITNKDECFFGFVHFEDETVFEGQKIDAHYYINDSFGEFQYIYGIDNNIDRWAYVKDILML